MTPGLASPDHAPPSHLRQRHRLVALFLTLGGVGYAAATLPRNSVGATQLKANAVSGAKVKDRSLTAKDFKGSVTGPAGAPGQAGATGPAGPAGPAGPQGRPGTPDGYTKAEADARFLGGVRLFTAAGFVTDSGADLKLVASNNKCVTPLADGFTGMLRELQLPDGATVSKVEVRYLDNHANNIDFQLRVVDVDGDVGSYGPVLASSGTASFVRTVTLVPDSPLVADADVRTPIVDVALDNDGTTNPRICSVKAYYSV